MSINNANGHGYLKTVLILLLGVIAALMLEYYYYNNQSKDIILDIYPNKPIILNLLLA
jgi:hypothetical protein